MIYEGKIGSLRRFKDDVSEVKSGFECGIGFDKFNDLKVGDVIEVFAMERVLTPRLTAGVSEVMAQGSRPDRVADQIRSEVASMLARDVHDPGIGFVTITRVQVTPDLQHARIHYTALGDDKARADTAKALDRAAVFLRRQIGSRLRLKRVPELEFLYDESIAGQDRIEQLLNSIRAGGPGGAVTPEPPPDDDDQS